MKRTITAAFLVAMAAAAAAAGPPIEPDKLGAELAPIREKAKAGDYQAQRNLAYSYATGASDLKGVKYPVAACAWYMSIPYTNGSKFDMGDSSNIYTYCRNLPPDAYEKAIRYSMQLVSTSAKR